MDDGNGDAADEYPQEEQDAWQAAINAGYQPPDQTYQGDPDAWQDWTGAVPAGFTYMQDHDLQAPVTEKKVIDYDRPPVWDGKEPEKQARAYIKLLKIWLHTTKSDKKQQGIILFHHARGDLKSLIDELTEDELMHEEAAANILKIVQSHYADYLEEKLPSVIESNMYDKDICRRKGESLTMYVTRRNQIWKKLEKEDIKLPSRAKGYITLRDAHLTDKAWDMLSTWTQNSFEYDVICANLKKLERPVPGKPNSVTLFQEEEEPATFLTLEEAAAAAAEQEDNTIALPMVQSLFVTPENFLGDEGLDQELEQTLYDEEVVYLAGDIPDSQVFSEEQAVTVCANWKQVRQYLHKERLNRGFVRQPPLPTKGAGKGKKGTGKA